VSNQQQARKAVQKIAGERRARDVEVPREREELAVAYATDVLDLADRWVVPMSHYARRLHLPRAQARSELATRLNVSVDALDLLLQALASTGFHSEERGTVITFVAFLTADSPVQDVWPSAQPISADSPAVLVDALRQVRELGDSELDRDGIERPVVLDETWRRHLSEL
jgi:hypothetical protein